MARPKKRNRQDATLVNIRALKARVTRLEALVAALYASRRPITRVVDDED